MPEFGIIKNGVLYTSETQLEGYKPLEYGDRPAFDQETQYVEQGAVTENEMSIFVEYVVQDLAADDDPEETEAPAAEFEELEPWRDPGTGNDSAAELKQRLDLVEGAFAELLLAMYQ